MPKPIADADAVTLDGSIWLTRGDQPLAGGARVALLAAIASQGSITQAAKAVGLSYKAAWDAVDAMNNLAGEPLVARAVGGKGGGGAQLTERGTQLVRHYDRIERAHQQFMAYLAQRGDAYLDDYHLLQTITMKTSARNQFLGQVSGIVPGAVNDEVTLTVAGGATLVAIITRESTALLGLTLGATAYALVKASSIVLLTGEPEGVRLSTRNQLRGTVTRVQPGAVNTDVTLALPGGLTVSAIVTQASAEAMGLAEGVAATALFKASSVILGVPG